MPCLRSARLARVSIRNRSIDLLLEAAGEVRAFVDKLKAFAELEEAMSANQSDTPLETISVHVTGHVQGVGYRAATVRRGHLLGVRGWVQNALDGSVQAMLQGTPEQIDRMLEWMGKGPPSAQVDNVTHQREYIDRRFKRFEQL